METEIAVAEAGVLIAIPEEHQEAAARYVAAILGSDPLVAALGPDYVAGRTSRLLESFAEHYTQISIGPYARHGQDALRIALGAL